VTDSTHSRLAALGRQLIETHHRLLDTVDRLRDGDDPPPDLRTHCLAFCAAITRHHTAEDGTVFPFLTERDPGLAPVLAELTRDHQMIATLITRAATLAEDLDANGARTELDGLAAILASHFAWEERRIAAALDALEPGALDPRW
jgi:hemerythrin-like domain-containing protein